MMMTMGKLTARQGAEETCDRAGRCKCQCFELLKREKLQVPVAEAKRWLWMWMPPRRRRLSCCQRFGTTQSRLPFRLPTVPAQLAAFLTWGPGARPLAVPGRLPTFGNSF